MGMLGGNTAMGTTAYFAAESRDSRGIDGNTVFKRTVKLLRHHRDILLPAVYIAKRHADELDILLSDVLHDFIF